jgi:hypothetical protein
MGKSSILLSRLSTVCFSNSFGSVDEPGWKAALSCGFFPVMKSDNKAGLDLNEEGGVEFVNLNVCFDCVCSFDGPVNDGPGHWPAVKGARFRSKRCNDPVVDATFYCFPKCPWPGLSSMGDNLVTSVDRRRMRRTGE